MFWEMSCIPLNFFQIFSLINIISFRWMNLFNSLLANNNEDEEEETTKKGKSFDFFCCFHAKDYFNIEEDMIFARIKSAIFLKPPFGEVIHDQPDLYGPFWISSTLIVVIIAASSLLQFFDQPAQAYDFDQLAVAACLIYGIAFGSPYIIAIMVKIFGGLASVVDLMCIYGYSLTSFLPVTAFCFIASELIQTILLIMAFLSSTIFIVRGVLSLGGNLGQKEKGVITAFIIGVQLTLVFMYKFYFFDLL